VATSAACSTDPVIKGLTQSLIVEILIFNLMLMMQAFSLALKLKTRAKVKNTLAYYAFFLNLKARVSFLPSPQILDWDKSVTDTLASFTFCFFNLKVKVSSFALKY
jgi:hypothetical protein